MRSCRQVLFPSDDCRYHAQGKSKGRCVFWRMVQTKGFKTVKTAPPNSRQRSLVSLSIQHNSVLSKLNEDVEAPLHVRTSSLPARAYTSQMSSPQKGLIFFFSLSHRVVPPKSVGSGWGEPAWVESSGLEPASFHAACPLSGRENRRMPVSPLCCSLALFSFGTSLPRFGCLISLLGCPCDYALRASLHMAVPPAARR